MNFKVGDYVISTKEKTYPNLIAPYYGLIKNRLYIIHRVDGDEVLMVQGNAWRYSIKHFLPVKFSNLEKLIYGVE